MQLGPCRTPAEDASIPVRRPAIAVAAVLLLLTVACGGPTPTPDGSLAGTPLPAATPSPDELIWALDRAPVTLDAGRLDLDPASGVLDPAGMQVAAQVFDRLVTFRPGTTQLAPGIAQNWQANTTENSFTFTLRDGLTFHDGTALDARAVAWNFNRWLDPQHPEHRGEFRAWEGLFGYKGQQDADGNDAFIIDSVEAIGPLQVRFRLEAAFAPFLQHIAMVPFGLSSPSAVMAQGEAYGTDGAHLPVGSGPFRVVSWDETGIRLVPFGLHWSGRPAAAGLRFVIEPDAAARERAIIEGRAHGTELSASPPVSVNLTAPSLRILSRPPRSTSWLMLDLSRPPLDNPRVRQAISLAIDRQKLSVEHFGPASEPASQLLPPGWLGHADDIPVPAFDLETAKQIFAEEGIEGTFRLNIFVPEVARDYLPDPVGTAESLGQMLEALGITPSVRAIGLRQFLTDRESGRFTAWLGGWEAQSPDPDNFWFFHFGIPARFAAEGHYQNGELARSLTNAQRLDTDSRRDAYLAAAHTVDADTARIFLVHARPLVVVSTRLQGYEPGVMGFDDLATVSIGPMPDTGSQPRGTGSPESGTPAPDTSESGTPAPDASESGTPAATTPESGTPAASTPGTPELDPGDEASATAVVTTPSPGGP